MARVLVGTCSWTDPTLLSSGFYPKEASTAEERLRFYAQRFPIVEVDSTYYAMPSERNAALWVERTPPAFVFDIKAFSLFTMHPTPPRALPKEARETLGASPPKGNLYYGDLPPKLQDLLWAMFESALLPLDSAGKLGVVLFQFPQWFQPGGGSREHILACRERLPQYSLAVEFRDGAWVNEKNLEGTLGFLRENGLAYVVVDEPQGFRSSVPPVVEAPTNLAIIRFHGHNRENWEKKGITATERFRYLYSREELGEWAPRLEHLASQSSTLHVLFNNCYGDYAVRNAQDMAGLLRSSGLAGQEAQQEAGGPRSPNSLFKL